VVLLAAGCQHDAPRPAAWRMPPPASAREHAARPSPPAVVPASHTEPAAPSSKFAPAQPPAPQPAAPAVGTEPPAAPKPAPAPAGSPASGGGPLALDEVLGAVERHYPLLRAAEQEIAIAGGRLLSATGAFDLNLTAGADGQGTTYDNFRSNVGVSRGLPAAGVGVFAGYRNGYGEFPTYNLGQKTADGGEFRAGVSIPLLQNRAIDRPRAAVRQAQLDVAIAGPTVERQRLDFHRAAARAYWNWVAAGHRLRLAAALVKLAAERDEQLKARVAAGPLANIERIDNQQNIALRNGVLVQAGRAFQQASIDLSLFLRDSTGTPTLAGVDRLPAFPDVQPIDAAAFDPALRAAFENRPEPRRLRLLRDKAAVELQFASNQMLPGLNAVVAASQDVGRGKSSLSGPNGLETTTVTAGLSFQVPVQRRDARGRVATATAQLTQIEQQLRQSEDVVRADVQDAFSALERAAEFYQQARQRVELTRVVANAERVRLDLGTSDILRVTLREQAVFDAEVTEIGAQQDYFRAVADFRAAVGLVEADAPR
jgi:outer membrane protein TolC